MGIYKFDSKWRTQDFYIDYEFEEVMYRWDHIKQTRYQKFYGKHNTQEKEIPHDQKLYNDAILYGVEITKEEYEQGKVKSE